jgi:TonB family protein
MLRIVFPGTSDYGANELKRFSRQFFIRGFLLAVFFHFLLLGIYWIHATFFAEKEKTKVRYVRIMTYAELPPPPSVTEDVGGEGLFSENGGRAGRQRGSGTGAGSTESRRISREAISREAGSKGLLGLMTGVNVRAVEDGLLGDAGEGNGVGENMDRLLSSLDDAGPSAGGGYGAGGETGTGSGIGSEYDNIEVRGERSDKQAGIDDLVTRLETGRAGSASRKGALKIDNTSEVAGQGKRSALRSSEAIRGVLLRHVPAVKYCYERKLRENPNLRGKIVVQIIVAPDGSVSDASVVSSTIGDPDVEQCILSRVRQWKDFEPINPNEGTVTFKQTYTFGS